MLRRSIRYIGALSAEETERLTDIAHQCPVHTTLTGQMQILTEVA